MFIAKAKYDQAVQERDTAQATLDAINALFGDEAQSEDFDLVSAVQSLAGNQEPTELQNRVQELEQELQSKNQEIEALKKNPAEDPANPDPKADEEDDQPFSTAHELFESIK